MFEQVRVYGLTNRPAGYAQVPRGWDRVEERTPQFRHGTVRYERALTLDELASFEMTPVYRDEVEACETLLAAVAEQGSRPLDAVKSDLRDLIALYDAEADPTLPPSYPLHMLAQSFHHTARIWPLGQYTAEALLPTMRVLLRPTPRAEVVPFRLVFDDAPRRRRGKRNGADVAPRQGVVSDWTTTMGGYQSTVIDGAQYLTLFDLREHPVRRGSVVEYEVGAVPEGWTRPYAKILRVVGQVALPDVPPMRAVRVGRRSYVVGSTQGPGLSRVYDAFEAATVDKVALRRGRVLSRSHGVVVGVGADGHIGRQLYTTDPSRDARFAVRRDRPHASFLGKVTTRFPAPGAATNQAALNAEAERAIRAAYGADWRAVEWASGGTVVAYEGPRAPGAAKPNGAGARPPQSARSLAAAAHAEAVGADMLQRDRAMYAAAEFPAPSGAWREFEEALNAGRTEYSDLTAEGWPSLGIWPDERIRATYGACRIPAARAAYMRLARATLPGAPRTRSRPAKRNAAVAERSRDWQTFETVTDDEGYTRERGRWHTDTTPPHLTRGHKHEPETVAATRTAAHVTANSYRLGNGESAWPRYLGEGNFGGAWRIETDDGPRVVKLATATNVHKRPWTREEQTRNLLHEAGVANELRALGFACMPRTVFVRFAGGTPALVREYGEPAGTLTGAEYADLEAQLVAIERVHGWGVHDELSLYRRADGTVFVGDVGFWQAPRPLLAGETRRPWKDFDSALNGLLERAQRDHGIVPGVTTLPRFWTLTSFLLDTSTNPRPRTEVRDALEADLSQEFLDAIRQRAEAGVPIPADMAPWIAAAEAVLRRHGPAPGNTIGARLRAARAKAAKG